MNQYMEIRTDINMKIKLIPYTSVILWTRNMNIKLLTTNENQTKFEKITDSINIQNLDNQNMKIEYMIFRI